MAETGHIRNPIEWSADQLRTAGVAVGQTGHAVRGAERVGLDQLDGGGGEGEELLEDVGDLGQEIAIAGLLAGDVLGPAFRPAPRRFRVGGFEQAGEALQGLDAPGARPGRRVLEGVRDPEEQVGDRHLLARGLGQERDGQREGPAGGHEQALQLCDDLLAGRPELPRPDRGTEAEIHYLKAKALFYLDDLEGSLFLVRRAAKVAPDVAVYRAFEGQILFELARFDEARRVLEQAALMDAESAHAVYHLALVLERLGDEEESLRAFRRANALDPEHYALPQRVDDAVFERASAEALANLPRSIREAVENVPLLIRDLPEEDLLEDENVSPTLLGIFIGVPRTEAALTEQARDVNRVILFKKNLEKVCRDEDELIEQIQTTVRHEIGHHLGLSEEDLEGLGLA